MDATLKFPLHLAMIRLGFLSLVCFVFFQTFLLNVFSNFFARRFLIDLFYDFPSVGYTVDRLSNDNSGKKRWSEDNRTTAKLFWRYQLGPCRTRLIWGGRKTYYVLSCHKKKN